MSQHEREPASDVALSMAERQKKRPGYLIAKRIFDVVIAGVLLVVFSPLMAVIAALVVLDTPGPAIFRQERVGLRRSGKGREATWKLGTFTFFKFRTMYKDSNPRIHREFLRAYINNDQEAMAAVPGSSAEVRKLVNDARVTRVGKYLRKSSLDELPQLWNVLKGDMSLVGPRPPIPYEVEMYEPWHCGRLAALPGITGLWQVVARSSADFDEMVELDLEYIEHQSFWLDLKVLLMTPLVVLRGKGAV
jgi:lipopolysaccharide/colanic/teichoic acid biosynthesis glycosyltransferase